MSLLITQCSKSHSIVSENNNKRVRISEISFPKKGVHLFLRLFTFEEEIESWCYFPTLFRIQVLKFHFLKLFVFLKISWHFGNFNLTLLYLETEWITKKLSLWRRLEHMFYNFKTFFTILSLQENSMEPVNGDLNCRSQESVSFRYSKQLLFFFHYLTEVQGKRKKKGKMGTQVHRTWEPFPR